MEFPPLALHAVCRGAAEALPGRSAKSGIFKHPMAGPVMIDDGGIVGDRVMNRKHHGGPDQALLIDGLEARHELEERLGHALPPGTVGENLVIAGLDTRIVAVGDRFRIGTLLIEATAPRMPCSTLALRLGDPTIVKRYLAVGLPGIYARVLAPGIVSAGDAVVGLPFAGDRVTITELMAAVSGRPTAEDKARYLSLPIASRLVARFSA